MAKHTPGEWRAECVGMSSAGDDGVEVFEVIADGRVRVAEYMTHADAKLCAASPALLKAATRAINVLKAQGETIQPGNVLQALDEAIRAAA